MQHRVAVRPTRIGRAVDTHIGDDVAGRRCARTGELGQAGGIDLQRGVDRGQQADTAAAHGQPVVTGTQLADVHAQALAQRQQYQVEQALAVTGRQRHPGAAGIFHLQGEGGVVQQGQGTARVERQRWIRRCACSHCPGKGLAEARQQGAERVLVGTAADDGRKVDHGGCQVVAGDDRRIGVHIGRGDGDVARHVAAWVAQGDRQQLAIVLWWVQGHGEAAVRLHGTGLQHRAGCAAHGDGGAGLAGTGQAGTVGIDLQVAGDRWRGEVRRGQRGGRRNVACRVRERDRQRLVVDLRGRQADHEQAVAADRGGAQHRTGAVAHLYRAADLARAADGGAGGVDGGNRRGRRRGIGCEHTGAA